MKYTCVYVYSVYIYVSLNHFPVYQKLTQHCKSTIFQFKKRKWGKKYTKNYAWISTYTVDIIHRKRDL